MADPKKRKKNHKMTLGLALLGSCVLLAVLVPLVSPWDPTEMNAALGSQGVSLAHPFGTDKMGRDLFVRVWSGAGISLCVGLLSALLNGAFGVLYGAVSGYAGKTADLILMRAADVIASVPSLLYVILLMMAMGANVGSILLGLCISGWIDTARLVRGEVMRMKQKEFILVSKMAGAGVLRIFWTHFLPNAAGSIVISLTALVPQAIFTEAFLSFLGVGIPAPAASLGTLIEASRSQMRVYPNQMLFPTAVLCILIFSLNLIGAGLETEFHRRQNGE